MEKEKNRIEIALRFYHYKKFSCTYFLDVIIQTALFFLMGEIFSNYYYKYAHVTGTYFYLL